MSRVASEIVSATTQRRVAAAVGDSENAGEFFIGFYI